jgi:hypothetical protein
MAEGVTVSGVKRSRAALEEVRKPRPEVSERLKAALVLQTSPLELRFLAGRADYVTCHGRVLAPVFLDESAGEIVCYVDVESSKVVSKRLSFDAVHKAMVKKVRRDGYVHFNATAVHRFVVAAALGVPVSALRGFEVDHKDAVKTNNVIENLALYLDQRDHARKTRSDNKDMYRRVGAANAVPVQQLDSDSGAVIATFPSKGAAAAAIGCHIDTVADGIRNGGVVAGFRWRRVDALHPRVAEMAIKVKEWRDLRLPDGTLVSGYQMSDNQLLCNRHGRITCGHLRGDGYCEVSVGGTAYLAHILLAASFHGPRPFPGAVVLHKDDKYDDVRAKDVRWGTQKENIVEAHGKPLDVLDTRTGDTSSYAAVSDVSKVLALSARAIVQAMKKRRPLSKHPHLRFAYAGEAMPSRDDWAFKTRMRTVDSVTGEVRVFDNSTAAAAAYGVSASQLSERSRKGGVVSASLPHIRVERLPGGGVVQARDGLARE